MTDKIIVVDGANIAFEEKSQSGDPKVSNLVAVIKVLREKGYKPIAIIDASLQYEIDDPQQLESMIEDQDVRQVPADTNADYFVLETAERYNAKIVSNDQYESFREKYPWVEERRVPLMIINGKVELYEPSLKTD